ncbi:Rha family transcriptional regulator, partial [Campylobacter coli]|uniref:Rha family transcriptional regulator n=3 Tax=Campylobacteraceae TaxID=72294 RepID=UPI00156D94C0
KIEGFRGRERKYPYYQLTKDGFSFIAMGLTGRKADKFKIAFINAFNEMEKLLQKEIKSPNKYLTDLMELIYPNLPQNDYKVSVTITNNPYSKEAKNVFSLNYLVDNRTPKDPKKLQ